MTLGDTCLWTCTVACGRCGRKLAEAWVEGWKFAEDGSAEPGRCGLRPRPRGTKQTVPFSDRTGLMTDGLADDEGPYVLPCKCANQRVSVERLRRLVIEAKRGRLQQITIRP